MSVVNLRNYSFGSSLFKGSDFRAPGANIPSTIPISTTNLQIYTTAQNSTSNPGSGTTWFDLSGNGYNGTLTNGAAFAGAAPAYVSLDGTNDYVEYGDLFDPISAFTIQGWWYASDVTNKQVFASKWADAGNQRAILFGHRIDVGRGPSLLLDRSGTFGTVLKVDDPDELIVNTWYHLAATYDGNTAKIYPEGVEIASGAFGSTGNLFNSTAGIRVGNETGGAFFNGRVGEFDWYNAALAGATVLSNFNATKTPYGK